MGLYTFPESIPGWTVTTIPGSVVPFMHVSVSAHPPTVPPMNEMINSPLTHWLLPQTLLDLSEKLYHSFRRQLRLFVHGVAATVLHPLFAHRENAQDVDYIRRSFVSGYRALGLPDAEQRFRI